MLARRLTGLVLTLLTLHLNLLGVDFACATHSMGPSGDSPAQVASLHAAHAGSGEQRSASHAANASGAMSQDNMLHTNMAHEPAAQLAASQGSTTEVAGDPAQKCDLPVQSNCCRALISCSLVFSASNASRVASAPTIRVKIVAGINAAPPSEVTTPEPPPPKA